MGDAAMENRKTLEGQGSGVWDAAYNRGGNICFYPDVEIVRFINRFIRKRHGVNEFEDLTPLLSADSAAFASLDLGCGIGRHVKFLDEFGLNPYGIDLSGTAVSMGKEWMLSMNRPDLSEKMYVASVAELPFEDDFFGLCVSSGVLDSMPRRIAVQGLKEVKRVLKRDALMYLNLILSSEKQDADELVQEGYEEGTIQSYFTVETIKKFLSEFEIVDFKIITLTDDAFREKNKRAHIVVRNSKHGSAVRLYPQCGKQNK